MLYFHNDVLGIPILIKGCNDIELVNSNFDHSGWFISNKEVYHNNIRAASRDAGCNLAHIPKHLKLPSGCYTRAIPDGLKYYLKISLRHIQMNSLNTIVIFCQIVHLNTF